MSCIRQTAVVALAAAAALGASSFASGASKGPALDGVWKIANVVQTGGGNPGETKSPQPSQVIFSGKYYSYLAIPGNTARTAAAPAKDPAKPTDAEKLAKYEEWGPFTANAGVYVVKGHTITLRPTVAKNVSVMTTEPLPQDFKLSGDTLVMTAHSAPGEPAGERRVTLTRVK